MPRFLNPPTVAAPSSRFSHGVLLAPAARRLIVSGQVGARADGSIHEDLKAQVEQIFDNIFAVVGAADMLPTDIVKIVTYYTAPEQIATIREVRQRRFGQHAPASTLVQVAALANPKFMVEIEAEAVQEISH